VIRRHYESGGLAERLLAEIGDPRRDVGPALDQFHVGGAKATRRLAEHVGLPAGAKVLDVGAGLGGPARLLAENRGWDVTGIDLSPDFARIATALSARLGQACQTRFCAGDALSLPFANESFDAVWTEHVAMNIAARDDLYRELARVVRAGGGLALYDVVAGADAAPLTYPVPWARAPDHSHMVDARTLRTTVEAAGWTVEYWEDETEFARDWLNDARAPRAPAGPTLRQVMGDDFPVMIGNLRDNFADGRLGAVQAVCRKPA
jgi:sarcosine/dimethylglycine N-methyltransferase